MAVRGSQPLPSVLRYEDHRAFLRDLFAHRKAKDPAFSHAFFARKAGLTSTGHLKAVLDAKLNLSPEAVEKYVAGFRLQGKEAEGFRLLVRACQAKEPQAKAAAQQALRRFRYEADLRPVPVSRAPEAQRWANKLVMALSRLRGFRGDPHWISRRLKGRITPGEAREAIRFLKESGYLRLRGTRLVGVPGHTDLRSEGPTEAGWRLLREAAKGRGMLQFAWMPLTYEEAVELNRKMTDFIRANIPHRTRPGKGKEDLCVLLTDIFPLTS